MKPISLVMPYYDNPAMLRVQQEKWRELPDDLKPWLSVVIVDDASPKFPAVDCVVPTGIASLRLYRTLENVKWNDKFARNLGGHVVDTDWFVMTDIDHVVPEPTLASLVHDEHDPRCAYRFARLRASDMGRLDPHQNTWFLTRQLFDDAGGYDERFSGFHGCDYEFFQAVHRLADEVVVLDQHVLRVPRKMIGDASTTTLRRRNRWSGWRVSRIKKRRNRDPNWKPVRLSFPYEQLL